MKITVSKLMLCGCLSVGTSRNSAPAAKCSVEPTQVRVFLQKPTVYTLGPQAFVKEADLQFGTIISGQTVEATFTINNVGNSSLIIQSVQTSCGCTVAKITHRPVPAGHQVQLHVYFDTSGREGQQRKVLVMLSNSVSGPLILTLNGIVTPGAP